MRVLICLFFATAFAHAAPQEFASGPTRTRLLELFTSEGCSSCPPAERWIGQLRTHPGLWRDFVPVTWHVDYWDRLGWKDRFASRAATDRQYAYAKAWQSDRVYTPCFVLDAREWQAISAPDPGKESTGVLRGSYTGDKLTVSFAPSRPGSYEAHVVVLAMGIESNVTRGENSGRTLHHDFVVAGPLQRASLVDQKAGFTLSIPEIAHVKDYALALWVTSVGDPTPVQATGGLLERQVRSLPFRATP